MRFGEAKGDAVTTTMTVRGFTADGEPFTVEAPFMALRPGDRVVIDGMYHEVVVVAPDGTVHVGRGFL